MRENELREEIEMIVNKSVSVDVLVSAVPACVAHITDFFIFFAGHRWLKSHSSSGINIYLYFFSVDTEHSGFAQQIGAVGANWRLCKWLGIAYANGVRARFCTNRQFYARDQGSSPDSHATASLSSMS